MFASCLLLTAQSQKGKEFSCSFGGSSESSAVGFSSGKQLWGFLFPFIFIFFMLFDTWNHFGLNPKLLRRKKRCFHHRVNGLIPSNILALEFP